MSSFLDRALSSIGPIDQRLDRLIGTFFPEAELRRLRARAASRHVGRFLGRSYEGGKKGRRTDNWRPGSGSANADISSSLPMLRARSRDLVRNNPWAARAVDVLASNTIGTGIIPQAKAGGGARRLKSVQAAWQGWGETTACDVNERLDHFGLQNLVFRTMVESGEILGRKVWSKDKSLSIPVQIQLLEPDFLCTTKDGVLPNKNRIIQGVEFSGARRVAYHLYVEHPGESGPRLAGTETVRVPAEDVVHVFRQVRPGQVRGVPWGSPALMRMRDLDDYEDAQLVRQKIAACYTAFVTSPELDDADADGEDDEEFGRFQPGQIERLGPGEDVKFGSPPPAEGFDAFTRHFIRSIAVAFGVTYESISGDYSQVNFSSGRMGWIEMARNIDAWRWLTMMPLFNVPTYQWFMAGAELVGKAKGPVFPSWTPPRREMIDPGKETAATIEQIKAGLKTWSEAVRENGLDPEDVADEMAADQKMLDEKGLKLTSDNRTSAAQPAAPAPAKKKSDAGDDSQEDPPAE